MAYATVEDLEAQWRTLTDEEQARAEVLLDNAGVYLDALVKVDPDSTEQAQVLRTVSCSMVQRVMSAGMDTYGVSQASMSAGVYSQSMTFANPSGDFYLTGFEKMALGINGAKIGTIRPVVRWLDD